MIILKEGNTMKINWKVRFQNKVWLTAFVLFIVSAIYRLLSLLEITPKIPEATIIDIVTRLIDLAALLGMVIDPTTKGVSDSDRAMNYEEPN